MATAEIIAVGSELLTPHRSDTNSLWLTEQLNSIGIEVVAKTVVGDDLARLERAAREAIARSDLVIATGGLGPTEDDVTRQAFAVACGRPLILREELVAGLRDRFARSGREMTDNNLRQAMIPEGAEAVPNPNGTAPGIRLVQGHTLVVLMPGPPREMKAMFREHVQPGLAGRSQRPIILRRLLKVTGMGESQMDERIAPIYTETDNPLVTINFTSVDIELHLTARAPTAEAAERLLDRLADRLAGRLGVYCYSQAGEDLEEVVGRLLAEGGHTLATAESLTGGMIGERLTRVPGSSGYYRGGIVSYSEHAKSALLGVDPELIKRHGVVSGPVAEAMAAGVRQRLGTSLGVSTTGIAGPSGGSAETPVGTVYVGLATAERVESKRVHLLGDRELIRQRASQTALDRIRRRWLLRPSKEESPADDGPG
ncbi:MAG: competence/damage-inducible protein A [Armatimonadetes bacterium]|nr:competence/damage-inducible protein A [Armatimonadota bacterium]